LEELRDRDIRGELASIKVPTTIFHGVADKVVPFGLGEEQHRLIAGSELVRFERSGHGLFLDEREKFSSEPLRFLTEEERGKVAVPVPT
jgi:pimeloyl-ACP methyl ester carboxylesterase